MIFSFNYLEKFVFIDSDRAITPQANMDCFLSVKSLRAHESIQQLLSCRVLFSLQASHSPGLAWTFWVLGVQFSTEILNPICLVYFSLQLVREYVVKYSR